MREMVGQEANWHRRGASCSTSNKAASQYLDQPRRALEPCWLGPSHHVEVCVEAPDFPARSAKPAPGRHYPETTSPHGVRKRLIDAIPWRNKQRGREVSHSHAFAPRGNARRNFFGQIDHRMVVHRPPRLFSGPGSVRLPDAWHLLVALEESGTTIALHAVDTGALVFRDHIEVKRLD